ncbi:MAG: hypothetical protein HKM02_05695 [Pseudomonadales bacterium]|nr:hypothetical protein [Pseudomonadales bacterium]
MYRRDLPKLLRYWIVLVMISGVVCRGMCLPMLGSLTSAVHEASPCGMVMPMDKHEQISIMNIHKHWTQAIDETHLVHGENTLIFLLFWLLSLVLPRTALPRLEPCPLRFPPPRLRYMRFQE